MAPLSWSRLTPLLDDADLERAAAAFDVLAAEAAADPESHRRLLWVSQAIEARSLVSRNLPRAALRLLPASGVAAARRAWGPGDAAETAFFTAIRTAAREAGELELWCELAQAAGDDGLEELIRAVSGSADDGGLLAEARVRLYFGGVRSAAFAVSVADEILRSPSARPASRLQALWISARAGALRAADRSGNISAASRAIFHTRSVIELLMRNDSSSGISSLDAETALLSCFGTLALLLGTPSLPERTLHALIVVSAEFYLYHLEATPSPPRATGLADGETVETRVLETLQQHLPAGTGILYGIGAGPQLIAALITAGETRCIALPVVEQALHADLGSIFETLELAALSSLSFVRAGWAHALPPGLLTVGPKLLAEEVTLVQQRSGFRASRTSSAPQAPRAPGRCLLWCPNAVAPGPAAPWTQETETRFVVDHFATLEGWTVTGRRGPAATGEALAESAPGADVIHISGNGGRGPRGEPILVASGGERLDARALSRLRLARGPLVFLNACDSAATCAVGGRWLDLVSALLDAGAQVIIASRVLAMSEYAPFFAEAFYRALIFAGAGEAFRHASSALRSVRGRLARPASWAEPDLDSQLTYELHGSPSWTLEVPEATRRRAEKSYRRWLENFRELRS